MLLGGWAEHRKLATLWYKQLIASQYLSSYLISLSWLLTKGDHIIPIPGMDKKNQVMMNVAAATINLSLEDIATLDTFPNLYSPKHVGG